MAATRVQTLTPDGTDKLQDWAAVGAASGHAATSDASDSSYIESSTGGGIARFNLTSYTLKPGEFVSGVVVRFRALTNANQTLDVSAKVSASTALGSELPHVLGASQPQANYQTVMFAAVGDPQNATGGDIGPLTQAKIDGMLVQFVCNESAAQAATMKVYEASVDLYISDLAPSVIRRGSKLFLSDGRELRLVGHNLPVFNSKTLAQWKTIVASHAAKGFNLFRFHIPTASIKTVAGATGGGGGWVNSELGKLVELLQFMNDRGLYADLTLNVCYAGADNPAWLESLSEAARWDERRFVARQIASMFVNHPAKAYICLLNEGNAPTSTQSWWRLGDTNGAGDNLFSEFIVKDPAGRSIGTIWGDWHGDIMSASDGVRLVDPNGLYCCGQTTDPNAPGWGGGLSPGLALFGGMSLQAPHIYPNRTLAWQANLREAASIGMPLIIQEFFVDVVTSNGWFPELDGAYAHAFHTASGIVGQSDGRTSTEYPGSGLTLTEAIFQLVMRWYEARVDQFRRKPRGGLRVGDRRGSKPRAGDRL